MPTVIQRCLAIAFAAACVAGAAGHAHADPPVRVAILPVVVNASEGHDYLRAGMADMLASRVGRVEGVAVTRIAEPGKATTEAKKAREIGLEVGADYVLYGSFTAFGAGASLDLACTPTAAAEKQDDDEIPVRAIFIQSGTLGDIIPKLDGVAERIARFAATGEAPAVAAAPPAGGNGAAAPSAQFDVLLQRIEALERAVFARENEPKPDAALRGPAPEAAAAAAPATAPVEPAPSAAPSAEIAPAGDAVPMHTGSAVPDDGVESQDLRRGELREDPDPRAFDPDRSIAR